MENSQYWEHACVVFLFKQCFWLPEGVSLPLLIYEFTYMSFFNYQHKCTLSMMFCKLWNKTFFSYLLYVCFLLYIQKINIKSIAKLHFFQVREKVFLIVVLFKRLRTVQNAGPWRQISRTSRTPDMGYDLAITWKRIGHQVGF